MHQRGGDEEVPLEAQLEDPRVQSSSIRRVLASFQRRGEGEGIGAQGGLGHEAVEAAHCFGVAAAASVAGDEGVPGEDVLPVDLLEGKKGRAAIAEKGVDGNELRGEEDVAGAAGDQQERVEAPEGASAGAAPEERVEIHALYRRRKRSARGGGGGGGRRKREAPSALPPPVRRFRDAPAATIPSSSSAPKALLEGGHLEKKLSFMLPFHNFLTISCLRKVTVNFI